MDNPHFPSFDHPRRRPRDSRKIPPLSRALPALDRLLRARVTARPSLDRRRAAVVMFHAGNPPPAPEEDAVAEPLESVDEADAETVARLDREMTAIGRARSVSAWSLRTDETTAARRRRLDRI